MKLQFDKFADKTQLIIVSLVVVSLFVGLSCVSAASFDANGSQVSDCSLSHPVNDKILTMTVKYNAGTGYHWEVAPETHGVTFMTKEYTEDHPGTCGSSGTLKYNFLEQSDDYYVKLVYISPSGQIVKVVDSDMLN